MSKKLGFSVYLANFNQQKAMLEKLKGQGHPIFTSLHIGEEVSENYIEEIQKMCDWLYENGFHIMADVSSKTLEYFNTSSLDELVKALHINNLRLDFGIDDQSLEKRLNHIDFTYNASTLLSEKGYKGQANYMHNFYPRPETGLDATLFTQLNQIIRENKGAILAFIAGDQLKRGPIYEGLPTLEVHRHASPYAQYIDLIRTYQIDNVYVGDVMLSDYQLKLILAYLEDNIIRLPISFSDDYENLYNQLLTVRIDSPKGLARVQESREMAQQGPKIKPDRIVSRPIGSVTIDNEQYKRYSGEIQITKDNYPADRRVNVIGQLAEQDLILLKQLKNGAKFMFVQDN